MVDLGFYSLLSLSMNLIPSLIQTQLAMLPS